MAHNLTDSQTYTAAVAVPDDGVDFRTAASLYPALQALANRTRYLRDFLSGALAGVSAVFSGTLAVADSTVLHGDLTVDGPTYLQACTSTFLDVNAVDANILGAFSLTATSAFASNGQSRLYGYCQFGTTAADQIDIWSTTRQQGPWRANSTALFTGAVTCASTVNAQAPITATGPGRLVRASVIGVQSGGQTISPQAGNHYYYPVVTANQNIQISDTGAQDGDYITIDVESPSFTVTLKNTAGSGGATLALLKTATGFASSVTVRRIAGVWFAMPSWLNP